MAAPPAPASNNPAPQEGGGEEGATTRTVIYGVDGRTIAFWALMVGGIGGLATAARPLLRTYANRFTAPAGAAAAASTGGSRLRTRTAAAARNAMAAAAAAPVEGSAAAVAAARAAGVDGTAASLAAYGVHGPAVEEVAANLARLRELQSAHRARHPLWYGEPSAAMVAEEEARLAAIAAARAAGHPVDSDGVPLPPMTPPLPPPPMR